MERLTHQGEHGPYWDAEVFDKHGGMEEDLIIDRLAYYEDMEEQGRLVVLPCKVGDRVWAVNIAKKEIVEDVVEDFDIWTMKNGANLRITLKNNNSYVVGKYGETVFSNEKEAEQALAFYCEGMKKIFGEDHSLPYSIFNLGFLFDGKSEEAEQALKGGAN